MQLRDLKTGRGLGLLHRFDQPVHSLAFRPDGAWLAAACDDRRIALWDVRQPPTLPVAPDHLLTGHTSAAWSVAFSPDGQYLASGADEGIIRLWDGATFAPITTLRGDTKQVRSLSFSHDGRFLAGAAYSAPLIIWDLPRLRSSLAEMGLDW